MVHELFVIGSGMALFRLVAIFVFRSILPRVGIVTVRIAEDIIVLVVYAAFILARLHIVGLDPSSLLTTSALITAVLAFSMQDTLGNVLSGVALQLDNSLRVGDWIKLDDLTGRVVQIHWRQTTIRTRNSEVVIVPNSQLMRGKFTVFGRADIRAWPWRALGVVQRHLRFATDAGDSEGGGDHQYRRNPECGSGTGTDLRADGVWSGLRALRAALLDA
jgi:small-conductance mechanosensitive channel